MNNDLHVAIAIKWVVKEMMKKYMVKQGKEKKLFKKIPLSKLSNDRTVFW